jgi:effector-binding domain-containing protein
LTIARARIAIIDAANRRTRRGRTDGDIVMLCTRLAAAIALCAALALGGGPTAAQNTSPPARNPAPPANPDAGMPTPLLPGDAFGDEVTLPERTIVFVKGHGAWDSAYDSLADAFRTLNEYVGKQGIKPTGPAMTIFARADDAGFDFQAALPIAEAPKNPPKGDIAIGKAPTGKALKFVHRGSYDAMDISYEAITNYLDDKRLESKDPFIEEYATNPADTKGDNVVVTIYVPIN